MWRGGVGGVGLGDGGSIAGIRAPLLPFVSKALGPRPVGVVGPLGGVVGLPGIVRPNTGVTVPAPLGATAALSAASQAAKAAAVVAKAEARAKSLDAALEVDPYDLATWDARIKEAVASGEPQEVFERAVKQFPFAARLWIAYADWCELLDTAQAMAVYHRCLQQVPSLDLWTNYLGFCKRFYAVEDVLRAYQRALDLLGMDPRAGLMWAEYISLLKHIYNAQQKRENPDADVCGKLLAQDANPMEAARRTMKADLKKRIEGTKAADLSEEELLRVGEVLSIDQPFLRAVFQRAASASHSAMEKLWVGYEQFEKSLGNPQLASKVLGEHMPRYVRGKAAFKELHTLTNGLDYSAVAMPLTLKTAEQQRKLVEKWRGVLQYERRNPLRLGKQDLQARVTLFYQQASLACAYHAELWHDFVDWLDLGGQRDEATIVLRRAIERFLPDELSLRLLLAQRYEQGELPPLPASVEAAEEVYQKLLEDVPKPTPLALINYLAFVRRQRGPREFRAAFLEAADSSPHCTWEVYSFVAQTEYHVCGSNEAAAKAFRLGLERYGEREPSLLAAFVNFLIGCNDLKGARAELSRGVLDRLQAGVRDRLASRVDPRNEDSLAFLWQKWCRLERYFGDAMSIRRCTEFRDEEFRNLQRDQEVDEEAVADTPAALGFAPNMREVAECFRFQHLVPQVASVSAPTLSSSSTSPAPAASSPTAKASSAAIVDQAVAEATQEHSRLAAASPSAGASVHVARPDVTKMLAFRPALDVVGYKRDGEKPRGEAEAPLPTLIPKCLQDLMAVLPSKPLKGAKPDVDYLLTVLQTVQIPPIPVQDLERARYDSLRLKKEEDNALLRRRGLVKDENEGEGGGGTSSFYSSRPTVYRERLAAKRQRLSDESRSSAPM